MTPFVKGPPKPIGTELSAAEIRAALRALDYVFQDMNRFRSVHPNRVDQSVALRATTHLRELLKKAGKSRRDK